MKQRGITKTYVGHETTEELNHIILYDLIGKNYSDDDYPIEITKGNTGRNWEGDSEPMSIKSLKEIIEKLEAKGANYIEFMFHGDHGEYEINGLEIHKSTKVELDEYEAAIKAEEDKRKLAKITKLEEEIKNLKKNG